jgi:acyl-[acyl-carrier-protein]-phospholipid O-acyltransferase/long-chain-fatty-acid--[acyl-carrier-protein] ligase
MMWVLYRIRVIGGERVPQRGAALLVSNHVSLMDGFLIGISAAHRHVRFMIWRPYYEHWALKPVLKALHAIPVGTGPRDTVTALRACRAELEAGHVVCIFA